MFWDAGGTNNILFGPDWSKCVLFGQSNTEVYTQFLPLLSQHPISTLNKQAQRRKEGKKEVKRKELKEMKEMKEEEGSDGRKEGHDGRKGGREEGSEEGRTEGEGGTKS
jgi:hypothetical protein